MLLKHVYNILLNHHTQAYDIYHNNRSHKFEKSGHYIPPQSLVIYSYIYPLQLKKGINKQKEVIYKIQI